VIVVTLKEAARPVLGTTEVAKFTVPVKPPKLVRVIVDVSEAPCVI